MEVEKCNSLVNLIRKYRKNRTRIIISSIKSNRSSADDVLRRYIDYGNPQDSTWGVLLLSRFPILNSTHHQLPSPDGELAVATFATVLIHNQIVDVLIAHNGQEEDPIDRQLQAQELGRLLSLNYPRPAVFLYACSFLKRLSAEFGLFSEDISFPKSNRSQHRIDISSKMV